ncbi:LysR family transcriptional regulator [Amycolatopsis saalfeldensis]|uniref:DNA-binding transcriptional regulator, LysR family n=1 Tax=Amycolatopsis saalfeldensis TaxID=394193 RepID=A0A1H8YJD4_9PSEU|nr:LysR family transcriptional regulator [Amycolatopsis saalfeldensis]SEP52265.1 DNA-binding transcriptional regulator, LysR family [Amycolatopsis saalfeldensis]
MPTLRALECLLAAAELGSVTRAAHHLHLSQPAISHQLAALEREAGTALLIRDRRGVRLTAAGRAASAEARRAVDAASDAIRLARAVGQGVGGTVRVECAQSLTVGLLAPVLADWHRDRPDITISFRESTNLERSFATLESGETDLLLFADPGKTEFMTTTVAEEEVVVALPASHPLASRPAIRRQELQGLPFVHFTTENGLGSWIEDRLDDVDLRRSVVARTAVTTHAPQLAATGLGVAVVPISAITAGFPGAVRPFEPRWRRRLVAMTTTPRDPLTTRLVDDLREAGLRIPDDVARQLVSCLG